MDNWKTSFLLGWPIFRGELLVSGRVVHRHFFETQQAIIIPIMKASLVQLQENDPNKPQDGPLLVTNGGMGPL